MCTSLVKGIGFSVLFIIFVAPLGVLQAQCSRCPLTPDSYESLYCYEDERFPSLCASFNNEAVFFYLNSKRKLKIIPYGSSDDKAYFLSLIKDRKIRLKAEEVLFLQEALTNWALESRKIDYTFTESGLGIKVIEEGTGDFPKAKEPVTVHYSGYLLDGTKFDSSYDRGEPITFNLGVGSVIKGWDEGILSLRKGAKAWLYIPPALGYGARATGPIPAGSTLIFQVEVLDDAKEGAEKEEE